MLQVDVPKTSTQEAFTRFVSMDSIYDLTPTSELVATARAESLRTKPISQWDLPEEMQRQLNAGQRLLAAREDEQHDDDDASYEPNFDE